MTTYRKIGGIHWLSVGPYRISVCRKRTAQPLSMRILVALTGLALVALTGLLGPDGVWSTWSMWS